MGHVRVKSAATNQHPDTAILLDAVNGNSQRTFLKDGETTMVEDTKKTILNRTG